jgi:hypothetical protein
MRLSGGTAIRCPTTQHLPNNIIKNTFVPKHSKLTAYMLKVSIDMVIVFLYIMEKLSIYMVNVLLITGNATKHIIHGSLDMVNILGHDRIIHEHATSPT